MKTVRKWASDVIGVLLVMIALWGGTWMCCNVPPEYAFAGVSTSILVVMLGLGVMGRKWPG